ncbi:MAG: c-type cytochrome biogenesis protein CcmI, partial [Burkholderiaceae bacterium]
MTLFLLSFAALTALAIGLLLPTLLRRRPPAAEAVAVDARRANLHILREQLHALDAEQAAGAIDAAQHAAARAEIERRAIDEEQPAPALTVATRSTGTAVGLGLGIPVFAFFVYGLLGNADAFFPPAASAGAEGGMTQAQVEDMVDRLSKRLNGQSAPQEGDAQAWAMLARSQAALERYAESSAAYQRARDLAPGDAPLMADHADVMAMVQGQRVAGEPEALALRALQIDPLSLKALALAGSGAFERKDFAAAARLWARALELAPPGSEFAAGIASSLKD